jgi:hypothetical protein
VCREGREIALFQLTRHQLCQSRPPHWATSSRDVGDIFVDAGLRPLRVTITAGNEVAWVENNRVHVAKTVLDRGRDAAYRRAALHGRADGSRDDEGRVVGLSPA